MSTDLQQQTHHTSVSNAQQIFLNKNLQFIMKTKCGKKSQRVTKPPACLERNDIIKDTLEEEKDSAEFFRKHAAATKNIAQKKMRTKAAQKFNARRKKASTAYKSKGPQVAVQKKVNAVQVHWNPNTMAKF